MPFHMGYYQGTASLSDGSTLINIGYSKQDACPLFLFVADLVTLVPLTRTPKTFCCHSGLLCNSRSSILAPNYAPTILLLLSYRPSEGRALISQPLPSCRMVLF